MEWLKTCANCKHFRKAWAWCAKKKQTREENWDACEKQKELVQSKNNLKQTT